MYSLIDFLRYVWCELMHAKHRSKFGSFWLCSKCDASPPMVPVVA